MILYKDILNKLKKAGYSTTKLRKDKLISEATLMRIRRGESISTNTIDVICKLTGLRVEDLIEYKKGNEKMSYKELKMVINKNEEIILYDGKDFINFDRLKEICGCKKMEWMGKEVYGDNDTYINLNDEVMDGICEENPAGEWIDDNHWMWGIHVNNDYVEFIYSKK